VNQQSLFRVSKVFFEVAQQGYALEHIVAPAGPACRGDARDNKRGRPCLAGPTCGSRCYEIRSDPASACDRTVDQQHDHSSED
jgi:hypothetical protein